MNWPVMRCLLNPATMFERVSLTLEPGMKIEIGESLIYSWLRHVQGCAVAQISWKPSPTWTVKKEPELRDAFEIVRSFATETIGVQVFKSGDFDRFIRQAEIDALGVHWNRETAAPRVFAVNTAFHESGLPYGGAGETVGRVLKKLIRAAFALEAYFDLAEADIVFATPKMAEPIRESIQRHLATLEMRLAEQRGSAMPRLRFRVIANADFSSEILAPVLQQVDAVADTSELFVRAQQLTGLGDVAPRTPSCRAGFDRPARGSSEEGSRIGEHVRATMAALAGSGRLTARMVGDLLDPRYCKAKFNLGLPLLKPVDRAIALSRQRIDSNGYSRYWKQPLSIGEHEFLMCSQWFVWQRDAFDAWVRDVG